MLQFSRRTAQIIALLLILVLPILGFYMLLVSGKQQKAFSVALRDNPLPALNQLYTFIHKEVDPPHNPEETAPKFDVHKGGIWSLTLFGINITGPLAVLGAFLSSRGFFLAAALGALVPVLFTVLFGRVFCSWVCPVNTLLEWVDSLRGFLNRLRIPLWDIRIGYNAKYYILFSTLAMAAGGVSVYAYILPYAILSREVFYYIFYGTASVLAFLLLFLAVFELLISQRAWCRYLCPEGAFLGIIGAKRVLGIRRQVSLCPEGCVRCGEVCKQGLKPFYEEHYGLECDNCGLCVSKCPSHALHFAPTTSRNI